LIVELIVAPNCPFCHRCLLVLAEKGAAFDTVTIDLSKKEKRKDLLSPYERVPVLWNGGVPIYESSIINEYIEETIPTPALMPTEPKRRAAARFWIDFCDTRFMPAYFALLKERDPAKREPLRARLLDHIKFIDTVGLAHLNDSERYWMGAAVTLVDFAFYPFFERFASVETYRAFTVPVEFQRLHAWLGAMRAQPSVRELAKPREHYVEYFRGIYADALPT
jgi:glutathione S-transferase